MSKIRQCFCICVVGFCFSGEALGQYGGAVALPRPQGGATMYGAPTGILPSDISPEKVGIAHLIPLLDQFEAYVRQDDLQQIQGFNYLDGAYYLFSFVSDGRFSAEIHTKYAKPLFEIYGEREPEVVRLYYLTGGSLKKLRELYARSSTAKIKRAIESCFFNVGEALPGMKGRIEQPSDAYPLSIKVSCKQKQRVDPNHFTSGGAGHDLKPMPVENIYNVFVEFKNTSTRPIRFSLSAYDLGFALNPLCFNIQRQDGSPVMKMKRQEIEGQKVVLYPGDRLVKEAIFNFKKRTTCKGSFLNYGSIFRAAFMNRYVGISGKPWSPRVLLAARADERFFFDIQFEQEYEKSLADGSKKQVFACSNIATLEYVPEEGTEVKSEKIKMWRDIDRHFRSWLGKTSKRSVIITSDDAKQRLAENLESGIWKRDRTGGLVLVGGAVIRGGIYYRSIEDADKVWNEKLKSGKWKKDGKGGIIREDGSVYRGGIVYFSLDDADRNKIPLPENRKGVTR